MKKNTKKLITIAVICIVTGLVLCVLGNVTGARSQLTVNGSGIHIDEPKTCDYTATGNVTKVYVNVDDARISVERTNDKYVKVTLQNVQNGENIKVTEENGTFSIGNKDYAGFNVWLGSWMNLFGNNMERVVTVYLPKDSDISELELKTSNGKIESYDSLNLNNLTLNTSNGKVCVSNVKVKDNTYIHTSNGSIDCSGEFTGSTEIKTSNGKIIANGLYKGNTKLKSSNGKIEFEADSKLSDYNIDAHTSNGSVYINEEKKSDDIEINANADNTLDINTSNGSITLKFRD